MKSLLAAALLSSISAFAAAGPALNIATVDGKTYDLAAERGHFVVVNFWATWCGPCLKEMPELSELNAQSPNIRVVGLAFEEIEKADMLAFLAKRPVSYPIAIADVYDPPADFPAPKGLPMSWLIGPDGEIVKKFLGPVTRKDLENAAAAAGSGG